MKVIQMCKENEQLLSKELTVYKDKPEIYFMAYPVTDKYFPVIARSRDTCKDLYKGFIVDLFTEEDGILRIKSDGISIEGVLKEFLESNKVIVNNGVFCIKLMLLYGVKLELKYDLIKLGYMEFQNKISYRDLTHIDFKDLCYRLDIMLFKGCLKNSFLAMICVLNRLRHHTERVGYKLLVKSEKVLAYSEYFGVANDIDFTILDKYREVRKKTLADIRKRTKEKYGIDFENRHDLVELLSKMLGYEIKGTGKKFITSLRGCDNKEVSDFAEDYIEYRTALSEKQFLDGHFDNFYYAFSPQYRLRSTQCVYSKLRHIECQDSFHTDESRCYYVRLGSDQLEPKVFEKLVNGRVISGDYHNLIASEIFNKPESEITKQERKLIKTYNFYRLCTFFKIPLLGYNILEQITMEEFTMLRQKLPLIIQKNAEPFELIMLSKLVKFSNDFILKDKMKPKLVLNSMEYRNLVFKVDNSVNPFRALKLLADCFDTTESLGFPVYTSYRVTNSYKELNDANLESLDLSYGDIIKGYNNITQEKVRNVVREVYNK